MVNFKLNLVHKSGSTPCVRSGAKSGKTVPSLLTTIFLTVVMVWMGSARAVEQPLDLVAVPDVNELGLLDLTGPNAAGNWPRITRPNQQLTLQRVGKALFWDMQLGGDGIQACATCHYHAGADHRATNQMSPGLKAGDNVHDQLFANAKLTPAHFSSNNAAGQPVGRPSSEAALLGEGWSADDLDGTPGVPGSKADPAVDNNDVVSSQGVRLGTFHAVTANRVDTATLAESDPEGFDVTFTAPDVGIPHTVRRVEPRNTPSVLNAVFNFRNFHDGRADTFFNGVNPLGFRDPDARVKTYVGGSLVPEKLRIPFSSLASQAVGPPLSSFEMHWDARTFADLGAKMAGVQPLRGQEVSCKDSLLGAWAVRPCRGGVGIGLTGDYVTHIKAIFDQRFWGNGSGGDVCLDAGGDVTACGSPDRKYTLLEWNFPLFFGLAIQAYEATLVTEQTIVDVINGALVKGVLQNGVGVNRRLVNTAGLTLEECTLGLALGPLEADLDAAELRCANHYAKFIHPKAKSGSQAPFALLPVPANVNVGGCTPAPSCTIPSSRRTRAVNTLLNVDRGLGRFSAGATNCAECHFNPEFTGATISALTGFGAPPPLPPEPGEPPEPPEPPPAVAEKMFTFNGLVAVYDSGFYNLGVRPTAEDISLGEQIGGIPLSLSRLLEILAGGTPAPEHSLTQINKVGAEIASNGLKIPTSPSDLTPIAFVPSVACAPDLALDDLGNPLPPDQVVPCGPQPDPGDRILQNGAFKTPGLRNVKFTGPYLHNGSKSQLSQVVNFYETAGHFPTLNLNNLDAGMRAFGLGAADEASMFEMIETGLTDWRVAYQEDKFDHPEICIPNGHDPVSGRTRLVAIPATGKAGIALPLQTFDEQLRGVNNRANSLTKACDMPGIVDPVTKTSTIDVPPPPVP